MSARNEGFFPPIKRAIHALSKGFSVLFVAIFCAALLDSILFQGVILYTGASNLQEIMALPAQEKNAVLIQVVLGYTGVGLMKSILIGPIFAALVVYNGRCSLQEKAVSLYKGFNFALNRYSRLFLPYMIAQLSIQLGNIIVIPGVMFMMQYAFVDSIASLENEKHVISRSVKLTKGRRKSLFLLILPWAILTQLFGFLALYASDSIFKLTAANMLLEGLIFIMYTCFFMLYDQRIKQIEELRTERANQASAETAEQELEETIKEDQSIADQ